MKLVTLTKDLRPWQAGSDAALPDALADQVIAAGDAVMSDKHDASGLQPDAPKPKARYLTRKG